MRDLISFLKKKKEKSDYNTIYYRYFWYSLKNAQLLQIKKYENKCCCVLYRETKYTTYLLQPNLHWIFFIRFSFSRKVVNWQLDVISGLEIRTRY